MARNLKSIVALSLVMVFMLSFTGSMGEAAGLKSDERFTLTMWIIHDHAIERNPGLQVAIEKYKELYPNATVNVEAKGRPEQMYDLLNIALSAGNPPDLFWSNVGQVMSFYVENDRLQSLAPYAQQYGWYDLYPKSTFDYQRSQYGDVYALPQDLNAMGVWYKKDLFEKFGLQEPKTYQELIDICHTLKKNGVVPFALAGKWPAITTRIVDSILEMVGGVEFHNDLLAGKASFNSPKIVDTFKTFKEDWVDNGFFQEGFLSAEETEVYMLWYPSNACFWFSGTWEIGVFEQNGQKVDGFDFFAFPSGTERLITFGNAYFMPRDSNLHEEAAAFLNVISSLEAQKSYLETFGDSNAARIGAIDAGKVSNVKNKIMDMIGSYGSFVPTNEIGLSPRMTDVWFEVLDQVILNQISPEEAAQRLDEKAKEFNWYK